jgi:hypothetical protein
MGGVELAFGKPQLIDPIKMVVSSTAWNPDSSDHLDTMQVRCDRAEIGGMVVGIFRIHNLLEVFLK